MENQGVVYLVGAGPGDPGLITEKGLRYLRQCDVVIYDHLASDRLLEYVKPSCELIYVGKQAGRHSMKQEEINEVLAAKAKAGHMVVRLKGGDPFVFGRGGEEVDTLQSENIPYEVVPGVTSAIAALCSAGIPATHRGVSRSFHVMTGHTMSEDGSLPENFDTFAQLSGTLIFLMGLGNLPLIAEGLLRNGKSPATPAAVIENGTLPQQKVVRALLGEIVEKAAEANIGTPAIIVVGAVAALSMLPTIQKTLCGLKVGVTGTPSFTEKLSKLLEDQGAQTECICSLGMKTYGSSTRLMKAYEELEQYSWLILTSANAVRLFFDELLLHGRDYRTLGHIHFATVGKGTARELKQYGFLADYVPEEFSVQALAKGLGKILTQEDRLLIPRSSGGSKELNETLDQLGISYDDIILYDVTGNKKSARDMAPQLQTLDYLTFASASGVEAFYQGISPEVEEALGEIKVVCIGDVTAKALNNHGRQPDIISPEFSIPGLVKSICGDVLNKETTHEN